MDELRLGLHPGAKLSVISAYFTIYAYEALKKGTVDFLTKKMVKNEGQIPQYYVTGSHEAIIDACVII